MTAEGGDVSGWDLTPAQMAELDQGHAAANEALDELIEDHRKQVREKGVVLATAGLTLHLMEQPDGVAAAFAAHAITRLAQESP